MNTEAAEFPRAWQRFFREAESSGYLERPNVVPLSQFGTDPVTGRPFYAIRFVGNGHWPKPLRNTMIAG